MTIRIGVNPIGWSNDDMRELGGETPLDVCLAEAKEAGFEGMELGHKFPRDPEALRSTLARFGLDLVSGWYSMRLLERDAAAERQAMEDHRRLLTALGAKVVIVAETSNAIHDNRALPLPHRPRLAASEWPVFARRLTELAERLREDGLTLVYHHHIGTIIESGDDIRRLMDAAREAVQLLLDTGHLTFAGADPVEFAKSYRSRIGHVHAKDVRAAVLAEAKHKDLSFLDAVIAGVFTVPGDGMVDYPAVLQALRGYSGWIVVEAEQDPRKAHPLTYAKMGRQNIARFVRESGLTQS